MVVYTLEFQLEVLRVANPVRHLRWLEAAIRHAAYLVPFVREDLDIYARGADRNQARQEHTTSDTIRRATKHKLPHSQNYMRVFNSLEPKAP
jgi:hypothetical protein